MLSATTWQIILFFIVSHERSPVEGFPAHKSHHCIMLSYSHCIYNRHGCCNYFSFFFLICKRENSVLYVIFTIKRNTLLITILLFVLK
ncbi:hypothetical protein BDF20DRAFT_165346 [Mycotypha africana]|uniref:uncharacterized protein n=1 Tax=Mycotypha africana TaxID=64632 RepID=UPI002300549D|nr:uncharacterized protein BDF20DRAFT_165346 [Mycotypha africana]KAI8968179.1 hypothetical protein BDF20DRAFT_165346 [Mycotypha africana]